MNDSRLIAAFMAGALTSAALILSYELRWNLRRLTTGRVRTLVHNG